MAKLVRNTDCTYKGKKRQSIWIFDFDLTLTEKHSGGHSFHDQTLFVSKARTDTLQTLFQQFTDDYAGAIYINSRGSSEQIKTYFETNQEAKKLYPFIKGIYGAKSVDDISPSKNGTTIWSKLKVEIIKNIMTRHHTITGDHIYFFDDTEENIKMATTQLPMIPPENIILIETPLALVEILTGIIAKLPKVDPKRVQPVQQPQQVQRQFSIDLEQFLKMDPERVQPVPQFPTGIERRHNRRENRILKNVVVIVVSIIIIIILVIMMVWKQIMRWLGL